MLKVTFAGTVLGELGWTSIRPTVKRSRSAGSCISSSRPAIIRTAARTASLRPASGAVPAWAGSPSTSITYQRAPWMPVTTPTCKPFASSCGPCSMCGSR